MIGLLWWGLAYGALADCEQQWATDPTDPSVWQCVYRAAGGGALPEALTFTAQALEAAPPTAQMHLTHANLLGMAGEPGARQALSRALVLFRESGDVPGQVKTHLNLANTLRHEGTAREGRAQLEAAASVAGTTEPFASMVAIEQSRWTCDLGGDYAGALQTLHGLNERLTDASFPAHGKVLIHHTRRCLADRLGRSAEARAHGRALQAFATSIGNDVLAVVTLDNLLWLELDDGPGSDFDTRVASALAEAQRVAHPPTVNDLLCLQAERTPTNDFSACRTAAADRYDPIAARAWTLATRRALEQGKPDLARAFLDRALDVAEGSGSRESWIDALLVQADWADAVAPDQAIAFGYAAVEAVRTLREQQADGLVRSRLVTAWRHAYDRQSTRLLKAGKTKEALEVVERLRGYRVLERLDRAAATAALHPPTDDWQRRDDLLEAINALSVSGEAPERLKALEREEAALRETLLSSVPAFAQLRTNAVDFAAVQAALSSDEALLVPILGDSPWMAVVRKQAVHAVELPGWASWPDRIAPLTSLALAGDPLAERGLAALSEVLLTPAAPHLVGVEHATVLPDTPVQDLPWGLLRWKGQALADQMSVTFAPSLRTWTALRSRPLHPEGATVIVSDPERRDGSPLPAARTEGASVAATAPGLVRSLSGSGADEQSVRQALTGPVRLLHVAAHSEVDPDDPERSAVLLAADAPGGGRLQAREVVGLALDGAVVVLASCRGADGEAGAEGVVGLSEAFLQAGARAVVASTVPLSDVVAEPVFTALHQQLAAGSRLDDGLAQVTRLHPEARALRVIGDGSVVLPGVSPRSGWGWLLGGGALFGLSLVGWVARSRR